MYAMYECMQFATYRMPNNIELSLATVFVILSCATNDVYMLLAYICPQHCWYCSVAVMDTHTVHNKL